MNEVQIDEAKMVERFDVGDVVATPGAMRALVRELLVRHQAGDWGTLDDEDKQQNEISIVLGMRILSAYILPNTSEKIWVITEADRSITTLLLPAEY